MMRRSNEKYARPFLKWAGGKTQLLEKFVRFFPDELKKGEIGHYYEPFLGSGAVFFFIAQRYGIKKAYLSDINKEVVLTFNVVKKDVKKLIDELTLMREEYLRLDDVNREQLYYKLRGDYNQSKDNINLKKYSSDWVTRAAQMIFLNKTCFNGLYRLNKKGEFNVPFGKYKNPQIIDSENLLRVSEILQIATIKQTDFEEIKHDLTQDFFVYFDPPYRPLNKTSNFTSYSEYDFSENDQIRLASLYKELAENGNKLMLSNSDPRNENTEDSFFEHHYKGYNINKVNAVRMINCKGNKRGAISELLITNYTSDYFV